MERIPLKWDEKQCGIYCIGNLENGKIYIGSSKNCYHRVRSQHFDKLQRGEHNNPHLQASWNKYGKSSFYGFCVEICEPGVLKEREQMWMDKTQCLDREIGYNINPYSDRVELTPEQRKKISLSKLGKPRKTCHPGITKDGDKWVVKIGFAQTEYYLGRYKTMSEAKRVYQGAMSDVLDEKKPDMKLANKMRSSNKKQVVQIDRDGEVARFESLHEAARHGYNRSCILRCCCEGKIHKGYRWRFA